MNCNKCRNYMDEMLKILDEIHCTKPEPEVCNIRCPPLGCPRGPCPGMCCYDGICNPCCVSKMPCNPPPPQPPRCQAPPLCCLKAYAKAVGYPPECPLSPLSARFKSKLCCETLEQICNLPKPNVCTTTPYCPSPCSIVAPSNPFPCS